MASFSSLPTELAEHIISYLPQPGLYAVCQVNKRLHQLTIPFLYRHIDLLIPHGVKLPRIDWFCLNVINDNQKAARVESIRLGLSSREDAETSGLRFLPHDIHMDYEKLVQKANHILSCETMIGTEDFFRDDIRTYTVLYFRRSTLPQSAYSISRFC